MKNILLCVSGLSPQIITESVYACYKNEGYSVPDQVCVITTTEGKERIRLSLLSQDEGWFHRLCQDYDLDVKFTLNDVFVIPDDNGNELADIQTQEDSLAAGTFITSTIREITQREDSQLHVSIAGGRKTMGFFAGYGLSLYGNENDILSHVLVSKDFEGHPKFYYPTVSSTTIYTREKKPIDTSKAQVMFAEIPLVKMKKKIPQGMIDGVFNYAETISFAQKGVDSKPVITLNTQQMTLSVDGYECQLVAAEFVFYAVLIDLQFSGFNFSLSQNDGFSSICAFLDRAYQYEDHDNSKIESYVERLKDKFQQRIDVYYDAQKTLALIDSPTQSESDAMKKTRALEDLIRSERSELRKNFKSIIEGPISRLNKKITQSFGEQLSEYYELKSFRVLFNEYDRVIT